MKKTVREVVAGISLFLLALTGWAAPQQDSPPAFTAPQQAPSPETTDQPATAFPSSGVDHSTAYYHYMLARRFRELAGINNRGDYVDRAISEYKKAMEADPDSLFLRVELAELYWRIGRIADAVKDAEAVLKINPDQADAHRLLANIYWRNLGEQQPEKVAKESLRKAIEHFEALSRLNPADSDNYLVLGRLYRLNNQPAKAEEALRKVLDANPDSRSALANLAQIHFDHGDYDQAVELLKRIPESDMDPQFLAMLGYAYLQTHDYDNAIEVYGKAVAADAENQEIRRAYADALMGGGRLEAARTELQKILKDDPDDGSAHLRLGQLERQEGRFDQARQEFERAKSLMPDSLEVPYHLALLEDAVGNEDKAVQILQGLIKQTERPSGQYTPGEASNRAIFLERLGLVFRSQDKYDQALEAFQQIENLGKENAPRAEALIVETLRMNRQPQKALEAADAAVQKYPQERSLVMLRATMLGERGRIDEAVQQLRALLNKTPADREVYLTIAQVYSQAKRFPEAEAAARQALDLSTKPDDQEYPHFVLGSIYERQKKYDLAEEQFRQVLATNPLNAAASNYLGYMLADRGVRLEESVKYIQKALELEPNNGAYMDSLGWAYYKMHRFDLAEPHLVKAARLISGDPTIQEHLGHLYLQMGKKREAQEAWERALKDWPNSSSSDFDAEQAAKLEKKLEELKLRLAAEKSVQH
ncbi:MAG: tetratricopeptide repeat protein [Terriglobia bacterium]